MIGFAGSGGMGTVYKIEHVITKRIEAMKLLPVGIGSDPEEVHRFEREIQVQARLHHPNIASLYNAVRDGHSIALIMEYVEGEPLQRKLERGRLPLHTAMNYAGQVLGALAYAHQNGVIHRDVTPANIIITPEGTAKLTDFGLARGVTDLRVTNAGVAVGSPWYMSPEQVRAVDEPDARTDIYSMGAVLYEMLTGRKLFEAEGSFALMCAQMEQVPKPPGTFNPAVPEALDHAIAKALAKDREARFQSAGEFRLALETAIADAPPAPAARISQPAPQPAQPQPARTAAAKQKAKALWAAARAALSGPASRLNRIRLPRAAMAAVAASATLTAILCGVALWPKPARVATKPAPAAAPVASAPAPIVPAAVTPAPAPPVEAPPIPAPQPAVPAVVNPVARTEPRPRPAAPAHRRQPAPKGLRFSGAVEHSPAEMAQPNPSPETPAASSEAPAPRPDASAAPEPPPAPPAAPSYAAPSAASEPAQQDPPAPAPADEKPRKGGHWFKRALDKINPFGKGDKAGPGDAVKPPSKD
ncbi:MAG: serine/threonine protein kinase [Acidobacteria bacterium]|nr:serine/threonine protein kinase [Acidobacteriota bacterium]